MYEYSVIINRIVDGDTVDVDIDLGFDIWIRDQRIRLKGIDAPESRTRDPIEKIYGLAAKTKLIALLSPDFGYNKGILRVASVSSKGKYGRILGDFIVKDGESVVDILISEHYGVPYHGQAKEDIEKAHLANRELLNLNE